jgi:hypothetical protein
MSVSRLASHEQTKNAEAKDCGQGGGKGFAHGVKVLKIWLKTTRAGDRAGRAKNAPLIKR